QTRSAGTSSVLERSSIGRPSWPGLIRRLAGEDARLSMFTGLVGSVQTASGWSRVRALHGQEHPPGRSRQRESTALGVISLRAYLGPEATAGQPSSVEAARGPASCLPWKSPACGTGA